MRRLSFLLLSLLLLYAGVHVVTGADSYASFLLRDGLLFWLAGGIVFALNAQGWRPPQPGRRMVTIVETGETLLLTGAVMAIAGATLMGWAAPGILDLMGRFVWIIGLILLIVGAWWPGGRIEYAPPSYRWVKDAGGHMVRMATDARTVDAGPLAGGRTVFVWLIIVLVVAAGLRFWNLTSLPPGCVANECINGLRLVEGQPLLGADGSQLGLYEQLARLLLTITNNSILSLRLSAAVFGLAAVVVMFALARRLTAPVIALFATALLALSPWHLWAGRSSDPWIATTLYAGLALWLALRALAWGNARWWVLAGLATALLFVETPLLRDGVFVWLLILLGLGFWSAWRSTQRRAGLAAVGAGATAAWACMIPVLMAGGITQLWAVFLPEGVASLAGNSGPLLGALLRPDAVAGPFAGAGLISGVIAVLIIAGVAALLRNLRAPAAISVLAGILLLSLGAARAGFNVEQPASMLLPILPFLLGAATVAIDRLITSLVLAWGPPMIRSAQLVAVVAVVLLLFIAPRTWGLLGELDAAGASGENQIETDAARYIAAQVQANPDGQTTYVAPPNVLSHPSVRLLAGAALAAGRVQPLELAKTLPYTGVAPGDLVYLAPVLETQLIDMLQELYPRGVAGSELNDAGDRTLFNTFRVSQADVAAAQGLTLNLFQGADFGGGELAAEPATVAALDYAWGAEPPLSGQFSALWAGSLVVPESGRYTFNVESGAPDAQFNLKLDDLLVLDTSLGLVQQEVPLAQGLYRVNMTYRSGSTPGDLRVRWQTPGAAPEILPGTALHTPTLPDRGLMAEYYPNDLFQGPTTESRKEPIIGLGSTSELPYSVKWQGKLAAPRAGEYLLSTAAQGLSQVLIDNQLVVDNSVALAMKEDAGYAEGLIYLAKGWHTIEARYAPNSEQPSYRLLWQPAGSTASELTSQYLRPTLGEAATTDLPLPPAPPLISPILGDDQFALSRPSTVWQPRIRIPPSDLPPMPLESLWVTSNGCGPAENQLSAPHGVAFSPDGSQIYVADTGNRRIVVYDIDGGVREVITSDLFQEPVDVAFEPDGTLAVLDAVGSPILRRVNGQMEPLPIQIGFYRPRGFTIDRSGNYFVADTGGGRVAVIGVDGASLGDFGGPDSMMGKGQPVDVMVDENRVWVVSAEDGRLWNMAGEGSFTAIQPTNTIDGPQLTRLADGRVLLSDPGRSTFGLYAVSGEPQAQFGYSGQFATPTGIASTMLGGAHVIAVTDTRQCTLSLWRLAQ